MARRKARSAGSGSAADAVLDPQVHSRLIRRLPYYAERAGIPPDAIRRGMAEVCGDPERAWVRGLWRHEEAGHGLSGEFDPPATDRLVAMSAALVRNFVDARYATLRSVVDSDDHWDRTVLLIPDFCPVRDRLPAFVQQRAYGVLVHRYGRGLQTVVAVSDVEWLEPAFGSAVAAHLAEHFTWQSADG